MKAKFDKIMANFVDDNKRSFQGQGQVQSDREKIQDFKNKNLKQNMKGIINKNQEEREEEEEEKDEENEVED